MEFILRQLKQNKDVFISLLKGVDKDMYLWKQAPEKWCLLEIVCHLYDEECEDFRYRTQWILEKPNTIPPPISPVEWVTKRHYMQQDYNTMLQKFLNERDKSIEWISSLENPAWENSYVHPKMGKLTAKHFYDNWLAHDYLHFRQITKLKFDYLNHFSEEDLYYAGKW